MEAFLLAHLFMYIKPMVTLGYLQSKETSLLEIRQPQVFTYDGGQFPKRYKVYYDNDMKTHKVVLKNFRKIKLYK